MMCSVVSLLYVFLRSSGSLLDYIPIMSMAPCIVHQCSHLIASSPFSRMSYFFLANGYCVSSLDFSGEMKQISLHREFVSSLLGDQLICLFGSKCWCLSISVPTTLHEKWEEVRRGY